MKKQKITLPIIWLVLAVSLSALSGCVSPRFQGLEPPPWTISSATQSSVMSVSSNVTHSKSLSEKNYRVKAGDSLSKIALMYDLNFRKLAAKNNIKSPWIIHPGQLLVLQESDIPNTAKASHSKPVKNSRVASQPSQNSVKSGVASIENVASKVKWRWPLNGTIVRAFGDGGVSNKGIDIQSTKAQSVMAAASGTVIFTGKGFGEGDLVIIQHNDSLLTAYDNTRNIAVKEKQKIKVGQKIAELNKIGKVWQLHFEIRNDGKPIDPKKYLPAL